MSYGWGRLISGRGCSRPHVKRFTVPRTLTPDSSPVVKAITLPRQREVQPRPYTAPPSVSFRSAETAVNDMQARVYSPLQTRTAPTTPRMSYVSEQEPLQFNDQMSPDEIKQHFGPPPSGPIPRRRTMHKGWYNENPTSRRASVLSKMMSWRGWK